jgi:hypothetical protein
MATKLIFLDYTFMFDGSTPFNHLWEFEKQLAEFFDSKGLVAENIKSVEGSLAKRVMFITKKPDMGQPEEAKSVGRPVTLKGQIKRLSDRKLRAPAINFMKGK